MIDADDSWTRSALRYAELAAHQIARFKNPWWNPTWHVLIPADPLVAGWGTRGKRSRQNGEKRTEAPACSPATPLDFGSGCGSGFGSAASTSGGEEAAGTTAVTARKRRRKMMMIGDDADVSGGGGGGCETEQAVWNGSEPSDFKITAAVKDMRRTGKKKTLGELQEEEKALLEEKTLLQKEVEMGRKAHEALKAENQRLKSQQLHIQSPKTSIDAVVSRASSSSDAHFLLPDLNEPLSEN